MELLVIDSGSSDGSPEIARAAGAEVLEIPPEDFGHGRTRNLGAERTTRRADLLPHPGRDARARAGWRPTARRSRSAERRRRRVRPAPAAAGHVADDRPRADRVLRRLRARRHARALQRRRRRAVPVQRQRLLPARVLGARSASTTSATPRTRRSRRAMGAHGWREAYHPGRGGAARARLLAASASCAATSTSTAACARRAGTSSASACARRVRDVRALVAADRRWMREQGWPAGRARAAGPAARRCTTRAARSFAALGSHAHRLPDAGPAGDLARGRGVRRAAAGGPDADRAASPRAGPTCYRRRRGLSRDGPAPLLGPRARAWPTPSGCTSRS